MTQAEEIKEIGLSLWGRSWTQEMARALKVDRSTIYKWRDGTQSPRAAQWQKLKFIADRRCEDVAAAVALCDKRSSSVDGIMIPAYPSARAKCRYEGYLHVEDCDHMGWRCRDYGHRCT